ncbi:hypothetical protein COB21_00815 [Candidatus Aerophobetes bacterium]|uniref:Uncharacterized protein n=1 Tax=Aerophobetes bacterium TaxID=2030807 RepID=A0A2A4X8N2_UNCAE|nr:MAG: hypothetical protein COB21_00815 [Candidatus Aerophobetes bacterium]
MDFTREPIIETIITPKDGYQLLIKNSKAGGSEHVVDAVEVISFGTTYFLRSLEKPAAFLLPFGEYEIVEKKVTRVALKKPQIQKSIKIETKDRKIPHEDLESDFEMEKAQRDDTKSGDKSKAVKRKRVASRRVDSKESRKEESSVESVTTGKPVVAPSLLPPPTTLISEQILRYKDYLQKEESAPTPLEEETKVETLSEDVEKILLSSSSESKKELKKVDVPLSVMKEADDFITQAQDDMFNQSLEDPVENVKSSIPRVTLNCTTPPPLIIDQEE